MLKVLERLKWVEPQNYDELLQVLHDVRKRCHPKVPLSKNPAKSLAQELLGKIPLVYGVEGKTDVVAHRLKTQFNENSKILAFWDVFPELNHNEIVGWGEEGKIDLKRFYPIFIRDHGEGEKIKKRIEVTQSIIKKRKVKWTEIWTEGKNRLTRVLSAIYMGDWVSFYLAIAEEVDPTPVKMIDFLKKELSKV
jgi:glucose/mannose-6-phosphate isomerase